MSETMTRGDVVEKAARAMLKLEVWRQGSGKGIRPGEHKRGESRPKRPFASADAIICEFTDDGLEQCAMLREAYQRAEELREL